MIRALRYIIIISLIVLVATWLVDQQGTVSLEWGGYQIDTTFGVMAICLSVMIVAAALIYRIWLLLRQMPASVLLSWQSYRREQGYRALTRGMVAVAAGDSDEAQRQARKADGLLSDPPLSMLLSAQAAQLGGDERAAERFFRAMTKNSETEFLGLRGLFNQAIKRKDTDEALFLARRAHYLKPKSTRASQDLFELQLLKNQWLDASVTVEEAARNRNLTGREGRRRRAVLACQMSIMATQVEDGHEANKQAKLAVELDSTLMPAVLILAQQHTESGKARKAATLIERIWESEPHPSLVALYWNVTDATTALERVKASQRLAGFNPGHSESDLAVAMAALEANLWGEARKHLEAASRRRLTARICRMMANLEEAEHDDDINARKWLVSASMADPDPAWVCGTCGNTVKTWLAICENCQTFDTFSWRTPPHVIGLAQTHYENRESVIEPDTEEDIALIDSVIGEASGQGAASQKKHRLDNDRKSEPATKQFVATGD